MTTIDRARFLLTTTAGLAFGLVATPAVMAGPASAVVASPSALTFSAAASALPAAMAGDPVGLPALSFESLDSDPVAAALIDLSADVGDDASQSAATRLMLDEQPPMIPLPPAVWAGLISLGGVAWHTLRQQRRTA